jgi:hypothetical protein
LRGRSSRDERPGFEPADGRALPPYRLPEVGDGPICGDDDADQEQRSEGDRRPDLTEEARRGLRHGAADEPSGDVVAHVMAREAEKRHDDDEPANYWRHRLAADESEPELERERPERQRDQPRCPSEEREETRAPPLQHRTLIDRECDRRQERERKYRDRADLVANARIDRRGRASAPGACGSPRHRSRPA